MKKISISKIVIIIILIAVLSILYFYMTHNKTGDYSSYRVGDSPSYINVSDCPEYSRFAINSKHLELIHKCEEEEIKINDKKYYYITLDVGPAGDCPSGCIYGRINFLVDADKSLIVDIPSIYSKRSLFSDELKNFLKSGVHYLLSDEIEDKIYETDFEHDESLTAYLGEKDNHFGWFIKSDKIFGDGYIFLFVKNGTYYWDITTLKTKIDINNIEDADIRSAIISYNSSYICPDYAIKNKKVRTCVYGGNAIVKCLNLELKCKDGSLVYVLLYPDRTIGYAGPTEIE